MLIKGKVPSLEEHTACLMDDKMYVFGGKGKICGREVEHSNNLYQLDLKTLKWKKICGTDDRNPNVEGLALPEPRYNHAMWTDNAKRRLYILGGAMSRPSCDPSEPRLWFENSNTTLGDCWYFDVDKQQWFMQELYGNFPAPRCEFYAATTSRGAVMFGGFTSSMYTFIKNPVTGDHNNVIHSTYLGDAFEFQSASSSFCMIQTQGVNEVFVAIVVVLLLPVIVTMFLCHISAVLDVEYLRLTHRKQTYVIVCNESFAIHRKIS